MSVGKKIKGGFRLAAAALLSIIRAPISFALSAAAVVLGALGALLSAPICTTHLDLGGLIAAAACIIAGPVLKAAAFAIDSANYYLLEKPLYSIAGASICASYSRMFLSMIEENKTLRNLYDDRIDLLDQTDTWYSKGFVEVKTGEDYDREVWEEMQQEMAGDVFNLIHRRQRKKSLTQGIVNMGGHESGSELSSGDYTEQQEEVGRRYASENLRNQRPGPDALRDTQKGSDEWLGR